MARSLVYIGIRSAQLVFALVVIGIAGFLLSDIKKATYLTGRAGWNAAGNAFNVGGVPSYSSGLSSSGSLLSSGSLSSAAAALSSLNSYSAMSDALAAQVATSINTSNNIKRSLYRRSPKGGGGKGGGGGRASSSSSSKSSRSTPIRYKVPLNMLIAVSVFTLLTAIGSIVINLLWPSWAIYVFWFYVPWDLFLAILWIAAAGLTGRFLTHYSGWKASFKQAHLFKTCFALALIFMLSFFVTAVLAFLICWRSRKNKAEAEPAVENPPVDSTAAGVPVAHDAEKGPPIYNNETAGTQAYYNPQQPLPYQPAMSPQPYQPPPSPYQAPNAQHPAPPIHPGQ